MLITVACITFGHSAADVERCLASARRLADGDSRYEILTVDDASGAGPVVDGIRSYVTPTRRGFAATAQFIVEELAPKCERLILINPDAEISEAALCALAESRAVVAVPTIRAEGSSAVLENVRATTSGLRELRNLMIGERKRAFPLEADSSARVFLCPPLAPSGAVISVSAQDMRSTPLRAEFFWLEFSDWVLRRRLLGLTTDLAVLPHEATHVGASTSVRYPLSVAASQASAKVWFVRTYGGPMSKTLLGLAVLSKALRFGVKQRSFNSGVFLYQAAMGKRSWMVNA